jgi:hypothetical protein
MTAHPPVDGVSTITADDALHALVTASSDVVYRMSPDWTEMRHLRGREFIADTEIPGATCSTGTSGRTTSRS